MFFVKLLICLFPSLFLDYRDRICTRLEEMRLDFAKHGKSDIAVVLLTAELRCRNARNLKEVNSILKNAASMI